MHVFLTGASGYIGGAVADALQKAEHTVTGLARSDKSAQELEGRGIRVLRGDLSDTDVIARGACEADGVIHTAATGDANTPAADHGARGDHRRTGRFEQAVRVYGGPVGHG